MFEGKITHNPFYSFCLLHDTDLNIIFILISICPSFTKIQIQQKKLLHKIFFNKFPYMYVIYKKNGKQKKITYSKNQHKNMKLKKKTKTQTTYMIFPNIKMLISLFFHLVTGTKIKWNIMDLALLCNVHLFLCVQCESCFTCRQGKERQVK